MGVDRQVSGVVPDDVGIELTSRGVLEDQVETFVLKDSADVRSGETSHECRVPPELKVAILAENTGRAYLLGPDL